MLTFDDVALLCRLIADSVPEMAALSANIDATRAFVSPDWDGEIDLTDQTALLKALTGDVVRLNVNISCYPLGVSTFLIFDENGNPL